MVHIVFFHLDIVRILLGWLIKVPITSPFPQQPGGMRSDPCQKKKKVAFVSEFGETSASENSVVVFSLPPPAVPPPPPLPPSLVFNLVQPRLERDGRCLIKRCTASFINMVACLRLVS